MRKYKRGVFLNVTSYAPSEWRREALRARSMSGLDHVEVWLEYLPSRVEAAILRDVLAPFDVVVHAPFIGVNVAAAWPKLAQLSRDRCLEALDVAADIQARIVTFHTGTYPAYEDREEVLDRLADFLPQLSGHGPAATVENMPSKSGASRECLSTVDDLAALKQRVPEVQFTLDIGHCIQNGDDYVGFLSEHSESVRNIHLHDAEMGGRGHRALGTGSVDLEKLVHTLREVRYEYYIGLETLSEYDTRASWTYWDGIEAEFDAG